MEHNLLTRLYRAIGVPLRQFYLLVAQVVSWRFLLLNRITIVLVIVLVVTTGAQAYIGANDDGVLEGVVVDENGDPTENATVNLEVLTTESVLTTQETTTDEEGRFVFRNYSSGSSGEAVGLEFRMYVATEGGYQSPTKPYHAWFPGQHVQVRIPVNPNETVN